MYDVYNLSHLKCLRICILTVLLIHLFQARSPITGLLIVSALAASLVGIESRRHIRDVRPPAVCEDIEDVGVDPEDLMSDDDTKSFFAEIEGMMTWDGGEAGSFQLQIIYCAAELQ